MLQNLLIVLLASIKVAQKAAMMDVLESMDKAAGITSSGDEDEQKLFLDNNIGI